MSTTRISLKSPPVVVTVLVLLAAVIVLNVQTFKSGTRNNRRNHVRLQAYPGVPSDMEQMVHAPAWDPVPAAASPQAAGHPGRDPFFPPNDLPPARASRSAAESVTRTGPKPLICTAVLLGGKRPMAIINDKTYGPGDTVRGMTINLVDTRRVELIKADGGSISLPVGIQTSDQTSFRMVTGSTGNRSQGRTSLADHVERERTP